MAVRERGAGYQIDVQYKGERYREQFEGGESGAKAREAQIRADLMAGKDPSLSAPEDDRKNASKLTLGAALETCRKKYWSNSTNERPQLSNIKSLNDFFGENTPLEDIKTSDVDRYIDHCIGLGLKVQTIKSRCSPLSKAFNHFLRRENIKSKPVFEYPKAQNNARTRVLTQDERDEIIRLYREDWDFYARSDGKLGSDLADFYVFFMDTGIRPIEIRHLETRHYSNGMIHVSRTKNDNPRTIPLTQRARDAWERQAYRNPANPRPFDWATKDVIKHSWTFVRGRMGMEGDDEFVPYILRHDCASRLYAATKNILVVKEWLGHKRIETTMRYAKLFPGELMAARDLLDGDDSKRHLELVS